MIRMLDLRLKLAHEDACSQYIDQPVKLNVSALTKYHRGIPGRAAVFALSDPASLHSKSHTEFGAHRRMNEKLRPMRNTANAAATVRSSAALRCAVLSWNALEAAEDFEMRQWT